MSRPQKIIPPIKGTFTEILTSVTMGSGAGRRAAIKLAREKAAEKNSNIIKATQAAPKKP